MPRLLEIVGKSADGSTKELLTTEQYLAVRYLVDGQVINDFCFDKIELKSITLRQLGLHLVYDWSIAELKFLE